MRGNFPAASFQRQWGLKMAQPVILKVYGNFQPVRPALGATLGAICGQAIPGSPSPISLDGNLARVSFEGIFFPVDDFIDALAKEVSTGLEGKLDVLDLEAWTLRRYLARAGEITSRQSPLNNVLDFSGH